MNSKVLKLLSHKYLILEKSIFLASVCWVVSLWYLLVQHRWVFNCVVCSISLYIPIVQLINWFYIIPCNRTINLIEETIQTCIVFTFYSSDWFYYWFILIHVNVRITLVICYRHKHKVTKHWNNWIISLSSWSHNFISYTFHRINSPPLSVYYWLRLISRVRNNCRLEVFVEF